MVDHIQVPVSIGEIVDKITILRIKTSQIQDDAKVANIRRELDLLERTFSQNFPAVTGEIEALIQSLQGVNRELWDIEDDIRDHERKKDFGKTFVELARSVYMKNDLRASLKRQINVALGSTLVEEKSYSSY